MCIFFGGEEGGGGGGGGEGIVYTCTFPPHPCGNFSLDPLPLGIFINGPIHVHV